MQTEDDNNDCLALEDENLIVVTVCKAAPQQPQSGAGVLEGPGELLLFRLHWNPEEVSSVK